MYKVVSSPPLAPLSCTLRGDHTVRLPGGCDPETCGDKRAVASLLLSSRGLVC